MGIDTGNLQPFKLKPYRTNFARYQIVDMVVNDMLTADIIHPSRSPWSFPIVVFEKRGLH